MIDLVTTPAEKDISVKFCKKNSVTFLIARGIMTKTDPHISFPATQQQQQQQKGSKQRNYSTAEYILLDSLKGSPGDNISTLLKKKWNAVCKSEYVQTLQLKPALDAS
jgi:hypothetical protein